MIIKKTYFELKDGSTIDSEYLARFMRIYTGQKVSLFDLDTIRDFALSCKGIEREVDKPSCKDLIRRGQRFAAIKLYKDQHPEYTLRQAYEAIDLMACELKMEKERMDV